jgi:hypothetical protein
MIKRIFDLDSLPVVAVFCFTGLMGLYIVLGEPSSRASAVAKALPDAGQGLSEAEIQAKTLDIRNAVQTADKTIQFVKDGREVWGITVKDGLYVSCEHVREVQFCTLGQPVFIGGPIRTVTEPAAADAGGVP